MHIGAPQADLEDIAVSFNTVEQEFVTTRKEKTDPRKTL